MTDATPYIVPKEPGRWRAMTLAALVHLALLIFFWVGIRWQSETPIAVEAEVWSPVTREAAPLPQRPVEPEPKPVVENTPKPEVKEPPVVKPEPPVEKPDIALEQEKKRKAEEQKKRKDEELAKKKAEEERLAKLKEEEEKDRLKKQKQKEDEDKLAKKKAEEKQRIEKEAQAKKAAEEKKRKEEDDAEVRSLAKARDEEMRRITGVAGTGGRGDAETSQGGRGDASYAQRVGAKIKSNLSFNVPESMAGNPAAEYEVKLLPDGSVAGMRKLKSSGVPGFDEAVGRAIEKAQPYPKDKSGTVPSSFIGIHRPKDQ
jgi:colicin import membrane protein